MKKLIITLVAITTTLALTGCCTSGYKAPFYKPSVIGCAPVFVPTR